MFVWMASKGSQRLPKNRLFDSQIYYSVNDSNVLLIVCLTFNNYLFWHNFSLYITHNSVSQLFLYESNPSLKCTFISYLIQKFIIIIFLIIIIFETFVSVKSPFLCLSSQYLNFVFVRKVNEFFLVESGFALSVVQGVRQNGCGFH